MRAESEVCPSPLGKEGAKKNSVIGSPISDSVPSVLGIR